MQNHASLVHLVRQVQYKDWEFHVNVMGGGWSVQVRFKAEDTITGEIEPQSGRKWYISPHMTDGEVVQTMLKAVLTAEEHEARENFLYQGLRIFNPHLSLEALVDNCDRTEVRS